MNSPIRKMPDSPTPGVAPAFDPRLAEVVADDPASLPAIACDCRAPERLRERFANPPRWSPEMTGDRIVLHVGPPRPAAVLVPIVLHAAGPAVLLTQRTAHLRQHSGQVAFPGGRHEPADRTPVHTALREAHEEVGLEPSRVEVIGRLPEYLTGTGFQVTPVVGLVEPGFEVRPDPHEVAEVFEVPLAFLMDPRHHQQRLIEVAGAQRIFWAMPWRPRPAADEYFIWGATAAMLRNLYRLLSA
jgi:8-oxo-dGTP pyrophosphatase MutT (NUDIX family)